MDAGIRRRHAVTGESRSLQVALRTQRGHEGERVAARITAKVDRREQLDFIDVPLSMFARSMFASIAPSGVTGACIASLSERC